MRFGTGIFRLGDRGTVFDDMKILSVIVDPPSVAAGAVLNSGTVLPANSAPAGSHVFVEAPDTIEAGLVLLAASIPNDDLLRLRFYNPSAAAINGAAQTWQALILTIPA